MGLLGKLRGKKEEKASGISKTPAGAAERIKNILGVRKLQSMPVQAARAFQLASDPKAKADEFVRIIEADEALSARIIRVANSVYFFRGTKASDIEKAVANIGLQELRCLISATMLRSLLKGKGNLREQIWANSVATGIACRQLAGRTNISSGEAFLCGLLHDVGKLIMVQRAPKLYEKVNLLVGNEEKSFIEAEEEVFELNHIEVGKWIAELWSFPEPVIRSIALHHRPWAEDEESRGRATSHWSLVKVADTFSHAAGIGHPGGLRLLKRKAEEELPLACQQLAMSIDEGESFIKTFVRNFEEEFSLYQAEK